MPNRLCVTFPSASLITRFPQPLSRAAWATNTAGLNPSLSAAFLASGISLSTNSSGLSNTLALPSRAEGLWLLPMGGTVRWGRLGMASVRSAPFSSPFISLSAKSLPTLEAAIGSLEALGVDRLVDPLGTLGQLEYPAILMGEGLLGESCLATISAMPSPPCSTCRQPAARPASLHRTGCSCCSSGCPR